MPQKREWDYAEVESIAGLHKKVSDVYEALRSNTASFSQALRSDPKFREAYNRGREKSGFKLYVSRDEASNGNGHHAQTLRARSSLDSSSEKALRIIENADDGISFGDLGIELRAEDAETRRAITILINNKLIEARGLPQGTKYFAQAESTAAPPRKRQATKQNGNGRSAKRGARASAGQSNGAVQATADYIATSRCATVMEQARVELLYQRAHGEPSPKFDDVVEGLEKQLVKAVASV